MILLTAATFFALGVFLGARLDPPTSAVALLAIATIFLVGLMASLRRSILPGLLLALLLVGMLRVAIVDSDAASSLSPYHGRRPLEMQGVVASDPEAAGTATRFRFSVDRLTHDGQWLEVSGNALVTVRESTELVRLRDQPYFRYGDRLLLRGALEAPQALEDFDYPAYLARQGIGSVMPFPEATLLETGRGTTFYRWLYNVRRRIAESLTRVVPEPQAAMGQALLLGLRDGLPEKLVDDFRVSGASHLLAISGLHVGILLGAGLAVSLWVLGRRRPLYLIAPLVLMWLYASDLGHVTLGDQGRDNGECLPGCAIRRAASQRVAGPRPRRRGDGGGQSGRALEHLLPAKLDSLVKTRFEEVPAL